MSAYEFLDGALVFYVLLGLPVVTLLVIHDIMKNRNRHDREGD